LDALFQEDKPLQTFNIDAFCFSDDGIGFTDLQAATAGKIPGAEQDSDERTEVVGTTEEALAAKHDQERPDETANRRAWFELVLDPTAPAVTRQTNEPGSAETVPVVPDLRVVFQGRPTNKKPRIVPHNWSAVEIDELIKCRRDGMSFQKISERLNRSAAACQRYASIHGCTKNQPMWSADETNRLRELRRLGHSWSDIGKQLGRSALSCQHRYKRLNRTNQTPQSLAHRHS
jgi:hypothetical protein